MKIPYADFESAGLGLERDGRMRLSEHKTDWAKESLKERERILDALEIPSIQIFHIGSTSVPGIFAKPILDLLMATPSLAILDSKKDVFERLGYECRGEFGLEGRRYYVLADKISNRAYVHLHSWEKDRTEILDHLIFRDYLRHHPEEAKQYEAVKMGAVKGDGAKREKYMDQKAPIISEIMNKARIWCLSPEARLLCSTEWQIEGESAHQRSQHD